MAHVLLFHHALGLTPGMDAFADHLRAEGHTVNLPDLFDGQTFESVDKAMPFVDGHFASIVDRAIATADDLPDGSVVAGFSLGTVPAQKLAQTRSGVAGALLYDGGNPAAAFGTSWPSEVELQIHVVAGDEWVELDVVRQLAADASGELFVYPGTGHLVADSSLSDHDPEVASLVLERTKSFLSDL